MMDPSSRRRFLKEAAVVGGVGLLGASRLWEHQAIASDRGAGRSLGAAGTDDPESARGAAAAALSPAEKAKLKAELQRELERKVYAVDEALFRKINRAARPGRYEGHERSHVPKIVGPHEVRRLEAFTVRVVVGVEEVHEMQPFHYVDWISLAIGDVQVAMATVAPIFSQPVVSFELTLEDDAALNALEHCNLHGTWQSEPLHVRVV